MSPRRTTAVAVAVLLVCLVAGAALSRVERPAPAVPAALASMPAETLTASVTDWSAVRAALAGGGTAPTRLLSRSYDADASAVSALSAMTGVMRRRYGWSVLDAEWEGLAQSRRGAAVVVRLPDDFDLSLVRERLGELGYREPFDTDGVWRGGTDLVAQIAPSLTPLMAHAVVLDEGHQVVFSDAAAYAQRTARVVEGALPSLAGGSAAAEAVGRSLQGSVAGVVHVHRRGCRVMGFGDAAGGDRALARRRTASVGGLSRFAAVGLGLLPGTPGEGMRHSPLLVAMHFDGDQVRPDEAQRRARLAVGAAPGQGGTFQSRFEVGSAGQRGGDLVLSLSPREAFSQPLSDLNAGELLFASCG